MTPEFEKDLSDLINRRSLESKVGMPDCLIAKYIVVCLAGLGSIVRARDDFFNAGDIKAPETALEAIKRRGKNAIGVVDLNGSGTFT